jgi:hypothetical protein
MIEENDTSEPEPQPSIGSVFKVIYLKLDEQGVPALSGKPTELSSKVYDKKTAQKFAAHAAQQLPSNSITETLVALVSPAGRCIEVLAGGTGRAVRPLVALRTKRALATLMPNEVVARRRTSRPLAGIRPARAGKRRTSRGRA